MQLVSDYIAICVILATLVILLLDIVVKDNDYLIKNTIETGNKKLFMFVFRLFLKKEVLTVVILYIVSIIPVINVIIMVYLLYTISPKRSELLLEYEKDGDTIAIYHYNKLVYATLNNNLSSKAVFTTEAYNYLVDLDDESIKFYMSVLKVCLTEAIVDKKYSIVVSLTDGHLAFERVSL